MTKLLDTILKAYRLGFSKQTIAARLRVREPVIDVLLARAKRIEAKRSKI